MDLFKIELNDTVKFRHGGYASVTAKMTQGKNTIKLWLKHLSARTYSRTGFFYANGGEHDHDIVKVIKTKGDL